MKIAIIGAGAMGSLFGGRLALAGQEVWLLDIWREHIDAVNQAGLSIISEGQELVAHPKAAQNAAAVGTADLLLIFVKSGDNAAAAKTARELCGSSTTVLTLQNGYGNAEELAELLGSEKIIAGTTAQGATLLGPGKVLHGGNGQTHIGEFSGKKTPRLAAVASILTSAGIPTTVETDVNSLIWGKLIVNVGINALTAITGVRNGMLAEYPETRKIMELAVLEAATVATASRWARTYSRAGTARPAPMTTHTQPSMSRVSGCPPSRSCPNRGRCWDSMTTRCPR